MLISELIAASQPTRGVPVIGVGVNDQALVFAGGWAWRYTNRRGTKHAMAASGDSPSRWSRYALSTTTLLKLLYDADDLQELAECSSPFFALLPRGRA